MKLLPILQFVGEWILIGILLLFVIGTLAHMMGLIVAPTGWKIPGLVLLVLIAATTIVGAILGLSS